MSWTCPHQIENGFCRLRKKECQVGAKGCVLEGKFKIVEKSEKPDEIPKKHKRT